MIMLYDEQRLVIEGEEFLFLKHLNNIIQNIDAVSKIKIKNELLNLRDIVMRYSISPQELLLEPILYP